MAGLALLPFIAFVVLLVGLRRSAAEAGVWSAAGGLAIAVLVFDYPLNSLALAGPALEAVFTSATILWIIFPALCIYEYQLRTGATAEIGRWLASVSTKPQIHALLLAWFFGLFLEGAAGFGTPIALVAPMLVGLGFAPLRALVLALFGHAAGVSFGAVGTPIVPLVETMAADPRTLSLLIMLLHGAIGWMLAMLVFRLARPDDPAMRASWLAPIGAALLFLVPAAVFAWATGPELPTLGGALIGALLFVVVVRRRRMAPAGSIPAGTLAMAAMPYLAVLVLILATRLVPPITSILQEATLEWTLGRNFGGSLAPLYHPGTLLMLSLLIPASANATGRSMLNVTFVAAARRLPPVALALVSVLLLARFMVHSGMIEALALAAAELLGSAWPLASPLTGALGSFVTGSATTSNIVLAEFQVSAASAGNVAPLLALAGQGFGAAIGNIVAPHNIVAGAATVGLIGREGEVLKQTLPVCLLYAVAGGALLLALSALLPMF